MKNTTDEKQRKFKRRISMRNAYGEPGLAWVWITGMLVYLGWGIVIHYLAGRALEALFVNGWGLNSENFAYAPRWMQVVVNRSDAIISVILAVGLIAIIYWIAKLFKLQHPFEHLRAKVLLKWCLVGAIIVMVGTAVFLALDSMRFESPFGQPQFGIALLLMLPVFAVQLLAEEAFLGSFLYGSARRSLRYRLPALLMVAAVGFLMEEAWNLHWIGMLNVVLKNMLCCLLHDRYGLAAGTGFRVGWYYAEEMIFSYPASSEGGVWSVYHVSEAWLTGGNENIISGLFATFVLMGLIVFMLRGERLATKIDKDKSRMAA